MTLYELAFTPINTPLTILLIVLTVYRIITTLLGFDFDLDIDVDVDVDVDADVDTDISYDSSGVGLEDINVELKNEMIVPDKRKPLKWWQVFLIYFNFAELPFMFTFTSFTFFWWIFTLIGTYITFSHSNIFGVVIFSGAFIGSLFINKIFTTPFKAFFKKLERKGVEALDLTGRTGTLTTEISNEKLGSVKLKIDSDPIIIYGKSIDGSTIPYNSSVLIIKESDDKKYYYIQPE